MPSKPPTHDALLRRDHPERFTASKSREDNARRALDPTSSESKRIYASARWQRMRRLHLAHEPLCRACLALGRTTPATDVDHITPIRDEGARFDAANLQSLCHACHASKTATETSARR